MSSVEDSKEATIEKVADAVLDAQDAGAAEPVKKKPGVLKRATQMLGIWGKKDKDTPDDAVKPISEQDEEVAAADAAEQDELPKDVPEASSEPVSDPVVESATEPVLESVTEPIPENPDPIEMVAEKLEDVVDQPEETGMADEPAVVETIPEPEPEQAVPDLASEMEQPAQVVPETFGVIANDDVVEEAEAIKDTMVEPNVDEKDAQVMESDPISAAGIEKAASPIQEVAADAAKVEEAEEQVDKEALATEAVSDITDKEKKRVSFSEQQPEEHTYAAEEPASNAATTTPAAEEQAKEEAPKKGGFFGFLKKHPKAEQTPESVTSPATNNEPISDSPVEATGSSETPAMESSTVAAEEQGVDGSGAAVAAAVAAGGVAAAAGGAAIAAEKSTSTAEEAPPKKKGGLFSFLSGRRKSEVAQPAEADAPSPVQATEIPAAETGQVDENVAAQPEEPAEEKVADSAVPAAEEAQQPAEVSGEEAKETVEGKDEADGANAAAIAGGATAAAAATAGGVAVAKKRGMCGLGGAKKTHDTSVIIKQGTLHLQGRIFVCHFKQVHCRLLPDGTFQYSKSEAFKKPVDVCLADKTVVKAVDLGEKNKCKFKYLFEISGGGVKKVVFAADSAEERDSWVSEMNELQQKLASEAESNKAAESSDPDSAKVGDSTEPATANAEEEEESPVEGPLGQESK